MLLTCYHHLVWQPQTNDPSMGRMWIHSAPDLILQEVDGTQSIQRCEDDGWDISSSPGILLFLPAHGSSLCSFYQTFKLALHLCLFPAEDKTLVIQSPYIHNLSLFIYFYEHQ